MLVFIVPLFCWMFWKKESVYQILLVILIAFTIYSIQDLRSPGGYDYSSPYKGTLVFQQGYVIDGGSLRGFGVIEEGTRVYATYSFQSAEEKAVIENVVHKAKFKVTGLFENPSPPAHDYAFDMNRFLKQNGASFILEIQSVESLSENSGFAAQMADRRERVKEHIRKSFPPALSNEAEALLIGEREKMTSEEQRVYQTLGISHLLAISGLHVGITAGLMYFILIRCRMRKETVLIVILLAFPFYAMLAGGAPSVWRAVSMISALLLCRLLHVKLPVVHTLFIVFTSSILLDPFIIYKIGFQLSYGACFGIIYSLQFLSWTDSAFLKGFIITFISQFTLYPVLIYHFFELSLSAFVVNSIFVPLYTIVILPANFLLLFLTFVSQPAADFVFYFYEPFRQSLTDLMGWLSGMPFQMWNPGKPSLLVVLILTASVILFYSLLEKRVFKTAIWVALLPALAIHVAPYMDSALKVTFLDVGQGDSAVIQLPYRKGVYLIDAGGLVRFNEEDFKTRSEPYEIGRQIVAPYLKGEGISSIDKLILSHPDADHAEGADEILKLFNVDELHVTPGSMETELMKQILVYTENTEIRSPGKGSRWEAGGIRFTYLAPSDTEYKGNDDSLVLLAEKGEFSLLLTGDLEKEGEALLIKNYPELKNVTILKVGHHGSKTSSSKEFLEAISPSLSVISAGRENRYGHPSPEVMERFKEMGLQTISTAENGTIEILLDPKEGIAFHLSR